MFFVVIIITRKGASDDSGAPFSMDCVSAGKPLTTRSLNLPSFDFVEIESSLGND